MDLMVGVGILTAVGVIGSLLVAFQIRDRLDKIASLLEKK